MQDAPAYVVTFLAWSVGGAVAGLAVHELGHLLAAGALGGRRLRLRFAWPVLRLEADLPDGPGVALSFLLAGALANLGAAGALWGLQRAERPWLGLAAATQVLVAVVSLVPIGESDGQRLLALRRRPGSTQGPRTGV